MKASCGLLRGVHDADLDDLAKLVQCLEGPEVPSAPLCTGCDFDADHDVDLSDGAIFQLGFTGS